jgi:SAM-dependent methyltransferase
MQKYLAKGEILKYPVGKKYKKNSYGGDKVFLKKLLTSEIGKKCEVEFFLHRGNWSIEKKERSRTLRARIPKKCIRRSIHFLNCNEVKKPAPFSPSIKQYIKLYRDYGDADELGYYESSSPEYVRVQDILSVLPERSLVYDGGCNSGGIGKILIRKKKCQVYGSEISTVLASRARGKGLIVFSGWAEKTPFKNNFFDFAILSFILEHAISPQKVLKETVRLIKPGGKLIGHVPTEFGDWGEKTIGIHPEHLRAFSYIELKKMLKRYNLKKIIIRKDKFVGRRVADYYFFQATK